jgi:hypothetical protein
MGLPLKRELDFSTSLTLTELADLAAKAGRITV